MPDNRAASCHDVWEREHRFITEIVATKYLAQNISGIGAVVRFNVENEQARFGKPFSRLERDVGDELEVTPFTVRRFRTLFSGPRDGAIPIHEPRRIQIDELGLALRKRVQHRLDVGFVQHPGVLF